jgi:pimeloyl-ACP methyl ester carboxylesterase
MHLVFIHGSGGSKDAWRHQTEYFKNAAAVDLPGHPQGVPCSTIPDYAKWVNSYITEQGFSDVILVGHSLGGGIALSYALQYPDSLKGLILAGSGLRLRVHPMFLNTLEKAIQDPELFEKFTKPTYERIDPELTAILQRRTDEIGAAVMLNDMRACDRFDVMGRENELKLPILAVCGSDDAMTPPKYSQFIGDKIPGSRVVIIPGGTHFVFAEKPKEFNQAVEDFLKSL